MTGSTRLGRKKGLNPQSLNTSKLTSNFNPHSNSGPPEDRYRQVSEGTMR